MPISKPNIFNLFKSIKKHNLCCIIYDYIHCISLYTAISYNLDSNFRIILETETEGAFQ